MGKIKGLSHITLICQDLERSACLYADLFEAEEIYCSEKKNFSLSKEKFLFIGGLWIALMEGQPVERSYRHIAFQIEDEDFSFFEAKVRSLNLDILPGRPRALQEGRSLYFYDYDNHLFELHAGDLSARLLYYRESAEKSLKFC
jgi:fosfomycin resistance protein FosX